MPDSDRRSPGRSTGTNSLSELAAQIARGEGADVERLKELFPDSNEQIEALCEALSLVGNLSETEDFASKHRAHVQNRLDEHVPRALGDFELVCEIGRGGMGVVYEARQVSLGKQVALKILPLAGVLDCRVLARFQNEARAAAQLQHPNIVSVHAVGSDRGIHYYAMQYIDGSNFARLIDSLRNAKHRREETRRRQTTVDQSAPSEQLPSSPKKPKSDSDTLASRDFVSALSTKRSSSSPEFLKPFLRAAIQVADALHYAHTMGVVHRDVKPANLLLDLHGDTWLTDFGLAQVQGDPGLTLTGDVVGTLRFMSPEQAYAKRVVVDHRTDIYSLGVTLYELLTLEPAFSGETRAEILKKIAFADPKPPRTLNRHLPLELDTIIMKSLSKNPDERYQTAQELADDLRRFQNDDPIRAKRPTLAQRAAKWSRKHKPIVASTAIIAVVVFLSTAITAMIAVQAKARAERSLQQEQTARQNTVVALQRSEGLRGVANALQQLQHDPALSLALGVRAAELHPGREANDALLRASNELREEQTLVADQGQFGHVAFSADGRYLAIAGSSRHFFKKTFQPARIRDLVTGKVFLRPVSDATATSSTFSPSGARLLVASSPTLRRSRNREGEVTGNSPVLWDWTTGRENTLQGAFLVEAHANAFNPSGTRVVTPLRGHAAAIWDASEGKVLTRLEGHRAQVIFAAYDSTGHQIVTLSDDNTVRLWDANGQFLRAIDWWATRAGVSSECVVATVAFSPDGKKLVTASFGFGVQLWGTATGEQLSQKQIAGFNAEFTPNGGRLLVVRPATVQVYEAQTLQLLDSIRAASVGIEGIAVSADSNYVAVRSRRKSTVDVWRIDNGELEGTLYGHSETVSHLVFSAASTRLATTADDQTARLWHLQSGRQRRRFARRVHSEPEPVISFSSDSKRLVMPTQPRLVTQQFDLDDLDEPKIIPGRLSLPQSIGTRLLTMESGKATVFDIASGSEVAAFESFAGTSIEANLGPDGTIAFVAAGGKSWLWFVDTDERVRLPQTEPSTSARFHPAGEQLAIRDGAGFVHICSIPNRNILHRLPHEGQVVTLEYSRGGERLLAVSDQNKAYLWDSFIGESAGVLAKPGIEFDRGALTADASRIITYRSTKCDQIVSWDIEMAVPLESYTFDVPANVHVSVHPTEDRVAIASDVDGVFMWNFINGERNSITLEAASGGAFSRDGFQLFTVHPRSPFSPLEHANDSPKYRRPALQVWEISTGELLKTIDTPTSYSRLGPELSADNQLFVQGVSYEVSNCDAATMLDTVSFSAHAAPIIFARFTPDGKKIATASWDHTAAIWDAESCQPIYRLTGHKAALSAAALSADGSMLATADAIGSVRVWDVNSGRQLRKPPDHSETVLFASFSPAGQLLTGAIDNTLRVTDVGANGRVITLDNRGEFPLSAEFAANGRLLVVSGGKFVRQQIGASIERPNANRVTVHDNLSATPIELVQPGRVLTASFVKGGSHVLVASEPGGAQLWDIAAKEPIRSFDFGSPIRHAVMSPDGTRVVTYGTRRTSVWDTETGDELISVISESHLRTALRTAFCSPDGQWWLTVSNAGLVSRWPFDPLAEAKSQMPRELTAGEVARYETDLFLRVMAKQPDAKSVQDKPN